MRGVASGYVNRAAGKSLDHAGDTVLFSDRALIGRGGLDAAPPDRRPLYDGPDDALATLDLLRPRLAGPMHDHPPEKMRQDPPAFATRAPHSFSRSLEPN